MLELDDNGLLRKYVDEGSEAAFATLVARHINKVYSVALRHAGNPHRAEEITQAVFVILAMKAGHLRKGVILSGWFYQTARLTALTFLRSEVRRAHREQEAHMQTMLNESETDVWTQIAPLLDAAMAGLSEMDRHAVVLRFFDGKSMREVGAVMGASEEAAKKRVNRAVEKLRTFFTRRGVVLPAAVLTAAISAHSVQAAPVALAKSVTAVAVARGAEAGGSTLTLIKGALKLMAWTKAKTAIVIGAIALIAGGTATFVMHNRAVAPAQPSSFTFAGFATPEACIQSYAWAMSTGDLEKVNECSFKKENLKTLSEDEIRQNKRNMRMLADALVGYTITQTETISDNEVHLHIHARPPVGDSIQIVKKVGNEWKNVGEARR